MKRILPFFLLLSSAFLAPFNSKAQTYLTNRQVYNFNVGDVFEWKACYDGCTGSPPIYYLTIVLQKAVSVTGDTISYLDSNVSYTPPHCYTCVGSFSTSTGVFMVTNLDSNASIDAYLSNCPCSKLKDTVFNDTINFCGRRAWLRSPDTCSMHCFEPIEQSMELVEGIGLGFVENVDNTVPQYESENLIYYKKGTDSCGYYYEITGINELNSNAQSVKVYPNPATDKFTLAVQSAKPLVNGRVEVYNVLGEMVYTSSINPSEGGTSNTTISLAGQNAGVYFVKLISEKSVDVTRVVKQ